jgi:hypothetical protein
VQCRGVQGLGSSLRTHWKKGQSVKRDPEEETHVSSAVARLEIVQLDRLVPTHTEQQARPHRQQTKYVV